MLCYSLQLFPLSNEKCKLWWTVLTTDTIQPVQKNIISNLLYYFRNKWYKCRNYRKVNQPGNQKWLEQKRVQKWTERDLFCRTAERQDEVDDGVDSAGSDNVGLVLCKRLPDLFISLPHPHEGGKLVMWTPAAGLEEARGKRGRKATKALTATAPHI